LCESRKSLVSRILNHVADGITGNSVPASAAKAEAMKNISVLIVDDSYEMRRAIKSFLAGLADQFYECSDGAQALAAYADHQPDWVLMDIKMKETDGLRATALILSAFPQARIVIITNYDDADLQRAAGRAGACAFVTKADLMPLRSLIASAGNSLNAGSQQEAARETNTRRLQDENV
jgi:CheY-like chemotaxis protein